MKHMNYAKRSLAVFLALVMCVGLLQLPAFAADEGFKSAEEAGVNKDEIPEINSSTKTNPDGSGTRDDSWDYHEKEDVTPPTDDADDDDDVDNEANLVDQMAGENGDYDAADDGSYTKTETKKDSSTTRDTHKQGGETRNDRHEDDGNGNLLDSGSVDGWQDTTVTDVTTSAEETTTVDRESTEDLDKSELGDTQVTDGDETGTLDDLLSGDKANAENDNFDLNNDKILDKEYKDGEIHVSFNEDALKDELLKNLNGWTVKDNEGKDVTVKVENGKVSYWRDGVEIGADEVALEVTSTGKGGTTGGSITATKTREFDLADPEYNDLEKGFEWFGEGFDEGTEKTDENGETYVEYVKVVPDGNTVTTTVYRVYTSVTGKIRVEETVTVSAWIEKADEGTLEGGTSEKSGVTKSESDKDLGFLTSTESDLLAAGFSEVKAGSNINKIDPDKIQGDGWYLTGRAFKSPYGIRENNKNGAYAKASYPELYEMTDGKGNFIYVYCVEHGTPVHNDRYEVDQAGDHPIYKDQDTQDHIEFIVENGWWGTKSGAGSIDAVRKLLKSKGYTDEQLKSLSPALAMAVTQAALWHFTSNGTSNINPRGEFCTADDAHRLETLEGQLAEALYQLLIGSKKTNTSEDVVRASDVDVNVDDTNITVSRKVESMDDLNKLVEESREVVRKDDARNGNKFTSTDNLYVTDVSVAVVDSKALLDEVIVYVYSNGVMVGSQRVTREQLKANNGKVNFQNIVMEKGATISFELEGVQHLNNGAYVFSAGITSGNAKSNSQTMVGFVNDGVSGKTSEHKIDMKVSMKFTVNENDVARAHGETDWSASAVKMTTSVTYAELEETEVTKDSVEWHDEWEIPGEYTVGDDDDDDDDGDIGDDDDDDDDVFIGDDDVPLSDWDEEIDLDMPDVPLANMDEDDELMDIEMDVPLAGVPHTGDESDIWTYVAIFSAIGMVALFAIERKKREEA